MKEVRYIIEVTSDAEFMKLPRHGNLSRTDWYMSDHRIRKMVDAKTQWQKIMSSQATNVVKKKTIIQRPNSKDLEKFAIVKLEMDSVRPVVDGKELYAERVTATKDGKTIVFYSSEAEDLEGLKEMDLLKKVDCIKSVKKIGEKSLQTIALEKLK